MLKLAVDSYEEAKDCPFRNVLDQLGDKWSFLILAVLEDNPKRFNEIKRQVGGISHRVLTRKLRDLDVTTAPELPMAEPIDTVPRVLKQASLMGLPDEATVEPEIT